MADGHCVYVQMMDTCLGSPRVTAGLQSSLWISSQVHMKAYLLELLVTCYSEGISVERT